MARVATAPCAPHKAAGTINKAKRNTSAARQMAALASRSIKSGKDSPMPIYAYHCPHCGTDRDEFRKVDARDDAPICCDSPMLREITAPMVTVPPSFAYKCQMSGEIVTTYRKRADLMKKHGVVDARDYTDSIKKKMAQRAAEKAEAKAYYDSLPDAVKKAATDPA